MKLIYLITMVIMTSEAQLPRNYLPPNQSPRPFQNQPTQTSHTSTLSVGGGSGDTGNRRPQQEVEKNAEILNQEQDVSESGFRYSYETSNGIKTEETGNAAQTQGGFSYKGDDGNTYTVTFTAGEGGFQPQGAHLPTAPPTPEDILQALEQNAKDEANGIFDDGKYRPDDNGPSGKPGSNQGYLSSGLQGSPSNNHQGGFSPNTGYKY